MTALFPGPCPAFVVVHTASDGKLGRASQCDDCGVTYVPTDESTSLTWCIFRTSTDLHFNHFSFSHTHKHVHTHNTHMHTHTCTHTHPHIHTHTTHTHIITRTHMHTHTHSDAWKFVPQSYTSEWSILPRQHCVGCPSLSLCRVHRAHRLTTGSCIT